MLNLKALYDIKMHNVQNIGAICWCTAKNKAGKKGQPKRDL